MVRTRTSKKNVKTVKPRSLPIAHVNNYAIESQNLNETKLSSPNRVIPVAPVVEFDKSKINPTATTFFPNSKLFVVPKNGNQPFVNTFRNKLITSHYLCQGLIGKSFFKRETLKADYLFLVSNENRLDSNYFKQLNGFALVNVKDDHLYLELICGRGTGTVIFPHIEALAKRLQKPKIKLSAIPAAMLTYYRRYGFKFSNDCSENSNISTTTLKTIVIINDLKQNIVNFRKQTNTASLNIFSEIKKLKAQKGQSKRIKELQAIRSKLRNMQNSVNKNSLNNLKTQLINKELVSNKNCLKKKRQANCNINGYSMTKCL